jgi:5-formyltetrahydrofolate cyclo-ligase
VIKIEKSAVMLHNTNNLQQHTLVSKDLKKTLREYFKQQRTLNSNYLQNASVECENLILTALKNIDTNKFEGFAGYIPANNEIAPNFQTIAKTFKKPLYLPATFSSYPKKLLWFLHEKNKLLACNKFGILQPELTTDCFFFNDLKKEKWIVFTPCLAVSSSEKNFGTRLGYGGGFYDNFLKIEKQSILSVGICYENCIVNALPADPWDEPVQLLISEKKIYDANNAGIKW